MGSETEFGILGGWTLEAATAIQRSVEAHHLHLPATKEGVFLENGSRVYVDLRCHNEYAGPEVDDPLLLVRHELAGRELMRAAAAESGHVLLCSNLDYHSLNAWGTHENYECRAPLDGPASAAMLSHLATRIAFSGAGGPHPTQKGMRFVLSPRAAITRASRETQGTLTKAMIFAKPEHYGAGHRLHVFCGESLLCPRASWLKYGTTALVAHALDTGLVRPGALALRDPLRTMHVFNFDVGFDSRYAMRDGTRLSGLEVQLRFADALEDELRSLPAWAGDVLAAWRAMLDALQTRDAQLHGQVDWLLYRRLWIALAGEYGFRADELPVLEREVLMRSPHVPPSSLERYLRLRDAACELYVRLHAMHAESPFAAAAEAGWLEPPLPGLEGSQVRSAIDVAPEGRASNRALLIRTLRTRGRHFLSWDTVHDLVDMRSAAIPRDAGWSGALEWQPSEHEANLPAAGSDLDVSLLCMAVAHTAPGSFARCFRTGDYDEAIRLAAPAADGQRPIADPTSVVLCHARMGRRSEARRELEAHPGEIAVPFIAASTRLFCSVHDGLVPRLDACLPLIEEGERLLPGFGDDNPDPDYHRSVFHQSRAWVWMHQGRLDEAIALLHATIPVLRLRWRSRMLARTRCYLAEALRRKADLPGARDALKLPARIYLDEGLAGDTADHYFPIVAKLGEGDLGEAALHSGEVLQRRRGNGLGLARTLCLGARLRRDGGAEPELRALAQSVEVLRDCPLMRRILGEWRAWVEGERREGEDAFWGL